jgi:hypothetical protein
MPPSGTPCTTYLEPQDVAQLRLRAKAADRSLAGEIRHALRRHLSGGPSTSESPAGQPSFREDTAGQRRDVSD